MSSPFTDELYLNPRYIFSSFVVGKSNNFAWAMAQAVASQPGRSYNPLFIYGGSGLGKTHLMHAIGHYVQKSTKKRVLYVSSEMFTNEFIKALSINKRTGIEEFRAKYRKVDVLLLDDVQFFAGKKETQEEFFHTFEVLYNENKQIVLTADKSPKDIDGLEERLITRFGWGMIADIQPPEFETRVAILQKKAEQDSVPITEGMNEVFFLIAEHVNSNIRDLEGALNRVVAYANMIGKPVSKQLVREALRDLFSDEEIVITPNIIKKVVASYYGIKSADLDSESRARNVSYPRQIAMYLCKDLTNLSYPKIGDVFGGRDHTTVIHACKTITKDMKENESLRELIEKFRTNLTEQA
jgi:chromosomal replication initiator protein